MTDARVLQGDVLRFAAHYRGEPFHALLCDPPYHLTSIVKRFGANGSKPANGDVYARSSRGFMGKRWDGGDIAFRHETWAAFASLLHDGAFIMAFASSRGWHRQAVAMEDAGLIIHSMIAWAYGSGFPKATRVKDAPQFSGHRYGLQALKPALEPILVARKPYAGKPRERIVETGAGALWIDGARIKTGDDLSRPLTEPSGWANQSALNGSMNDDWKAGRWPANLVLSHSAECNGVCAPDCAVRMLGEQSGESVSIASMRGDKSDIRGNNYGRSNGAKLFSSDEMRGYSNSGTAARFFYNADWTAEKLEAADPLIYTAKAGRKERDAGLDGMPLKRSSKMSGGEETRADGLEHGRTNHPEMKNVHPTIKPISLTRHLATLLLPPAEYAPRRLFVPFSGAGSEMIGALQAGWECIVGVEGEREYVEIAEKRLAYWAAQSAQMELIK